MKKTDVLKQLRAARLAHVKWLDRAKALVNGLFNISKEDIPLEPTSCEFGSWFYGEGQVLLAIFSATSMKKVEDKHRELHYTYMKIFKIYFDTSHQSFFAKLLKKKKEVSPSEQELAEYELQNLEKISNTLIDYLNILEKNLTQIDENDFKKLS